MTGVLLTMTLRRQHVLGTVSFSTRDASVYVRPIGVLGTTYSYGFMAFDVGEGERTFPTGDHLSASERPHISIHDSGATHVRAGSGRASLVAGNQIGKLSRFAGDGHVATIQTSDVAVLPELESVWPDVGAPDADAEVWDVTPPSDVMAARAAVFVSRRPHRRQLPSYAMREFRRRRADGGVLFVTVEVVGAADSLGSSFVGAIGGWNPNTVRDAASPSRFLYIRDSPT